MCILLPLPLGAVIVFPVYPGSCNTAILNCAHMAKVHEIGSSSIKSVFCLAYQHGFPNHFKNNLCGKVSRRRILAYIVLYMWGEYFIDILAHKVGKKHQYRPFWLCPICKLWSSMFDC